LRKESTIKLALYHVPWTSKNSRRTGASSFTSEANFLTVWLESQNCSESSRAEGSVMVCNQRRRRQGWSPRRAWTNSIAGDLAIW